MYGHDIFFLCIPCNYKIGNQVFSKQMTSPFLFYLTRNHPRLMSFSNQIAKYQLIYYGKRPDDSSKVAQITLYDEGNHNIGHVFFFRDDQNLLDNSSLERYAIKRAYLRMHVSQMDSVVDMLRNEKPCRVYYSGPTYAYIYTGTEPVGEEENPTPKKTAKKAIPTLKRNARK